MKNIVFDRTHILPLLLVGLLGLSLVFVSTQGDASSNITADQCTRCHAEVNEKSKSKRYVHAPVLDKHCAVCHVKGDMPKVVDSDATKNQADTKVEWFAKDCQVDDEHWFEVSPEFAQASVSLLAKAGGRNVLKQEVVFPALDEAKPFQLLHGNPEILNLEVVEVKKGVFLSARIVWNTDRIANAQVLYGENSLSETTAIDDRWATSHEITLSGLQAKKEYRFVAVSQDIFGNKGRSEEMVLSTHSFFERPALQAARPPAQIALRADFYQGKGRFFACFKTNHPVSMRLGYNGSKPVARAVNIAQELRPQDHIELTDPYALTIEVCVSCHPSSKGVHSHPVDIRPKAGMFIPPDYSTMADGRISCMSCHQAHASDNEYRLTRAHRKDLCLGCHRKFG